MVITRTKVRGFKAVTIKDIPTRIATRHYFAYQGVDKIANGAGFGIWVLLAVVLVSLADIVVNDFLPRRFKFRFARKYRHLVFMALAMGVLSLVYLAVTRNGPTLAQALLSFQGIGAACVAVLDLFARHKA